jgi:AGCS family alanine or glycine:cation symporter
MTEIFSADGWLNTAITNINNVLWTYILVAVLIVCAVLFTVKTRGVQFRMVGEMIRLLGDSTKKTHEKHVSSFEAFAVSIASRVGTGNLAGVATAIAVGGPGAIFWMWIIALLGSATAFVESTLAQLYKRKTEGSYIGGPAYYMMFGLHKRWMARLYAVLITITFCMAYISIQSNTICGAMQGAFGVQPWVMGLILVVLSTACVFGGINRIAKVSSIFVPVMAVLYILLALVILAVNIQLVPRMFALIIENAFGFRQFTGGTFGAMMMTGIKRGLFSNEAGEGSAACAASIADVSHPVKQGLVQALSVFTDTLLICSCTAFIILLSGVYTDNSLNGIQLTQTASAARDRQRRSHICRRSHLHVCLLIDHRQLYLWRDEREVPHRRPPLADLRAGDERYRHGALRRFGQSRPGVEPRRSVHGLHHAVQPFRHCQAPSARRFPAERLYPAETCRH